MKHVFTQNRNKCNYTHNVEYTVWHFSDMPVKNSDIGVSTEPFWNRGYASWSPTFVFLTVFPFYFYAC